MRPARWEAVAPTAGLPVATPVEITLAEPAAAQALQASLAAAGIPATLVQAPGGSAQTVLFTEGLAPAPMTARHWAALAAARHARQPGAKLIFLQRPSADTGLEGLTRTLRREWPEVSAACWTLLENVSGEVIAGWLASVSEDLWISPDGTARRAALGPLASPRLLPSAEQGLWLVTGGARGVTATCAIEIARRSGGTRSEERRVGKEC